MLRTNARPTAVTIVAWLITAKAAYLVLPILLYLNPDIREEALRLLNAQGVSFSFSMVWACFGAAVRIACALALFRGLAWGRILYFAYIPAAFLLTLYLYGFMPKDFLGMVVFAVFVVLLTQPPASQFFARKDNPAHAADESALVNK